VTLGTSVGQSVGAGVGIIVGLIEVGLAVGVTVGDVVGANVAVTTLVMLTDERLPTYPFSNAHNENDFINATELTLIISIVSAAVNSEEICVLTIKEGDETVVIINKEEV
jgi:hypothetical protein